MRKESASDVKAGAGAGVAHLQSSASMLLLNVLVAFVNIPLSVCYCSYTVIRFTKHDHFESISLSLSFSQLVLKVLGVTALTFGNYVMMKMQRSVAIPSSSISLTTAITSANTISTNLPPYMKYHLMFCVFFYMGTLVRLFDSCILMDVWDFENHTEGISQALVVVLKWYEGEHHSHHQFLSFSVLCTLFFPLLFQVIFHDTFLVYPVGSGFWFACFTSLLIVVVYHRSLPMGLTLIYYMALCFLLFHGSRLRRDIQKQQQAVEKEEIVKSAANHLNEFDENMRSMVGNVAHDLKTPLASFMTGLDSVCQYIQEGRAIVESAEKDPMPFDQVGPQTSLSSIGNLRAIFDNCLECLSSMSDTNNFMLMTIHRCIDYAKASKGLKLVPKLETLNLMETLSLPLQCMKNIQSRISINFHPIPTQIFSYIITDKQWLQENVLCLLSNAVKYSNGGHVNLRVALEEVDVLHHGESVKVSAKGSHRSARVFGGMKATSRDISDDEGLVQARNPSRVTNDHGCHNLGENIGTSRAHNTIRSLNMSASHSRRMTELQKLVMLRVEVEDEGIGMPEQAMADLFSAFKQTQRLAGGTGLGLFSLAKRMEALQGHCGVMKRRDGRSGSLFWFRFPYREDRITTHHKAPCSPRLGQVHGSSASVPLQSSAVSITSHGRGRCSASPRSSFIRPSGQRSSFALRTHLCTTVSEDNPCEMEKNGRGRVLLVEDTPSIVKMTSMMLKRNGYVVTVAENGAEALELIQKEIDRKRLVVVAESVACDGASLCDTLVENNHSPNISILRPVFDIILMDLQMPVMDGLEATRRLRDLEKRLSQYHCLDGSTQVDDSATMTTVEQSSNLLLRHKVIGVSANDDEETEHAMMEVGFDACLPKPFTVDMLQEVVEDLDLNPSGSHN
eukprot:scaffold1129_cov164-Ochromonas_danica.AAC.11